MNWDQIDYEQYRKELIKQAQMDLLAQEVLHEQHKQNNPALAWVGQRIANFGLKLVEIAKPDGDSKQDVSLN
ncbi:MAG: hypothetical protein J0M07_01040 [Anaerolineae bacterium]|uniref:hypothetical protein n=1 Tax=Candidatus Flexifilum breve TaxID=3140694 RepID=UPI001ACFF9A9|nr:hypothetical protein [Chloroflexota bacterium]MBK9751558.1 hypothetical protein [Chloroflexota bacterium]MBN8633878.1 hypothetical protein [Anaerolineae bacterium]